MQFDWSAIWPAIPLLIEGAKMTLWISVLGLAGGLVIGLLAGFARTFGGWIANHVALVFIEVIRGTPILLQLYVFYFVLPELLPFLDLQSEIGLHLLRKAAHFSEFAALGMSLAWLFGMLSKQRLLSLALPLLSGAGAAAIDETIQLFSPNRGPSIRDVGIDTAGVIRGIAVLTLLHCLYKRMKKR